MSLIKQVHAQIGTLNAPTGTITNEGELGRFFSVIISIFIAVAGLWFLFQMILAGIAYISGAGDQQKTTAAMKKITDSIIGLAIITISFVLTSIISKALFGDAGSLLQPVIKTF